MSIIHRLTTVLDIRGSVSATVGNVWSDDHIRGVIDSISGIIHAETNPRLFTPHVAHRIYTQTHGDLVQAIDVHRVLNVYDFDGLDVSITDVRTPRHTPAQMIRGFPDEGYEVSYLSGSWELVQVATLDDIDEGVITLNMVAGLDVTDLLDKHILIDDEAFMFQEEPTEQEITDEQLAVSYRALNETVAADHAQGTAVYVCTPMSGIPAIARILSLRMLRYPVAVKQEDWLKQTSDWPYGGVVPAPILVSLHNLIPAFR